MSAPDLHRGLRNNNPGNMEPGGWLGETGNDGRFAIFDTMEHGIRALARQLIKYYDVYKSADGSRIDTIREAISRWAPSNENHTLSYIAFVSSVMGIDPDTELDFHDRDTLWWFIVAIGEEENGTDEFTANVTDAQIDAGVAMALST